MNNHTQLEEYIREKISELDRQKDRKMVTFNGELSFDIDSTSYGHLPSWKELVLRKKKMINWVWIDAFLLSLMIVGTTSNVWEKFDVSWVKALLAWIVVSAVVMLFYVIWSFYSLFFQFRQTERQVRKLIYEDLLDRIQKEKA